MHRLPPLSAVRVFEAAARHQNFTQAAAELGMTQAAVSYQIRLLEERLGVPLFLRSKRRVTLSDAGRKAAPLVSDAFGTLEAAFAGLVSDDEGVLTISTTQTFAANWMAPRLGGFQVERPELAVRLKTENRIIDFAGEEVDVGIRSGSGGWPGLRHHFLFQFHSTPMCSPEFLRTHRLETPADLLNVPRLSAGDPWWKRWMERAGISEAEAPRTSGIWLDSQVMEGSAAMAGHGVAMMSPIFWRSELASGRLVAPFPIVSLDGFSIWLVYPEHKRNLPKIRAFREWLLREVAKEAVFGPPEAFVEPGGTATESPPG